MQDKYPINDKGQPHGFWEKYYYNGQLYYKGLYLNGLLEGPFEEYWPNGQLWFKCYYIKGERIGYNQWNYSNGSINETKFYAR